MALKTDCPTQKEVDKLTCYSRQGSVMSALRLYNMDNPDKPMKRLDVKKLREEGYYVPVCPNGGKFSLVTSSKLVKCSKHGSRRK